MAQAEFFQHRDCPCFPCHSGVPEADFNCLFCWCPLYCLGRDCPGTYCYTERGVKDCSGCTLPHQPDSYDRILTYADRLAALAGRDK